MVSAAFAGVRDDRNSPLAGHRGRRKLTNQAPADDLPAARGGSFLLPRGSSSYVASAGGLRTVDVADGSGGGAQFRFLSRYPHADDHVDVLYLSVRILAHLGNGAVFSRSGQSLGGSGCFLHSQ